MQRLDGELTPTFEQRRETIAAFYGSSVIKANIQTSTAPVPEVVPPTSQPIQAVQSAPVAHNHLAASVREIFDVNCRFHQGMTDLVNQINSVLPDVRETERASLMEFLKPYKRLTANPFNNKPTGDLEADLRHILSVAKLNNEHFRAALQALNESAANMTDLKSQLYRLDKDLKFRERVREVAGSPLCLDSKVSATIQHLVRYELLLVSLKKELVAAGYQPTNDVLKKVLRSIENIVPEVKRLNSYMDVVEVLNRCERVLHDLMWVETQKITASEDENAMSRHAFINRVYDSIYSGKEYIAAGGEDMHALLRVVLLSMQELQRKYADTNARGYFASYLDYAKSAGSMVASVVPVSLFAADQSNEKANPVDDLSAVIIKLEEGVKAYEKVRPGVKQ